MFCWEGGREKGNAPGQGGLRGRDRDRERSSSPCSLRESSQILSA